MIRFIQGRRDGAAISPPPAAWAGMLTMQPYRRVTGLADEGEGRAIHGAGSRSVQIL